METVEGITDVSSDRDPGGLQLSLVIDRKTASSLGVRVQDIDNALNNAFAQRQISIIYTQRNQYMVVLEIDPKFQSDPSNLERIFVAGANDAQVPLSAVVRYQRGLSPLAVFHSQSFPSTTVSFNVLPDVPLEVATIEHPARGRRTAHAGGHPRQLRRQCRRFQQDQRTAAAADPGRAGGDVYRARRAL